MPLIATSDYKPPFWLFNGHLQTIIPAITYRKPIIPARREQMDTSDGDFVHLDWIENGNKKLVVLTHGLEGSSEAPYSQRLISYLKEKGFDILAWNFRGCSGVMNRLPTFYHSGMTSDLREVINYALSKNKYEEIYPMGVSIGGNITLKYLGEENHEIHPTIKKAVIYSVPCLLASSAVALESAFNQVYMARFLKSFKEKFNLKNKTFPGTFDMGGYSRIRNFYEFDNRYTARMFGFEDTDDYYETQSSKQFIPDIRIPTLIINAQNDPFLGPECYPKEEAKNSKYVFLEMPKNGGHAGYPDRGKKHWMGERAWRFIGG